MRLICCQSFHYNLPRDPHPCVPPLVKLMSESTTQFCSASYFILVLFFMGNYSISRTQSTVKIQSDRKVIFDAEKANGPA